MNYKLKFKIELQYSLNNEQVIFCNEIFNDGVSSKLISVGDNKVIEKTINDRVLSGECLFDGISYGYTYVYDKDGITIDLKQINENMPINISVNKINEVKNSKEFNKANMNGLLAITNSEEFISIPGNRFIVCKQVSLIDDESTYVYLLKKNFISIDINTSIMESEEEIYQINNDFVSIIKELKTKTTNVHCNVKTATQEDVKAIIDELNPLKNLLKSTPKSPKNLNIEFKNSNIKKTIR